MGCGSSLGRRPPYAPNMMKDLAVRLRHVRRGGLTALGCLLLLTISPGRALAHGDIQDSSPAKDTLVTKAPREVTLILAEPPAAGSDLTVTDGCGREVSGETTIERQVFSAAIAGGEPGRWSVKVRSISAVDGHLVRSGFTFEVEGTADCAADEDASDADEDGDETSSRPPIDNPGGGGSRFPVVPFAVGTVAVIALAVAIRRPWNKT